MADKITEDGLKALIDSEVTQALGYVGKLSAQRQKAITYYNGDAKYDLAPPEVDGRSSVVSSDVADVVEQIMPAMCKIFTGSDEAVAFSATNEQGEKAAEQATAYCNYVFYRQNKGFQIIHNWFKDALIEKSGIVKVYWDDSEDVTREEYKGMTIPEITMMLQDKSVQIIEAEECEYDAGQAQQPQLASPPQAQPAGAGPGAAPGMAPNAGQQAPASGMASLQQPAGAMGGGPVPNGPCYDITVKRTKDSSQVRIENVPPEEFLLSRRARTMDEPFFVAHRVRTSPSKLKAMGYSNAQIERCTSDSTADTNYNQEAIERRSYDDSTPVDRNDTSDPSMRDIWMTECYLNVDWDNDGIAELRKVTKCGSEILDNDPVDDHPFCLCTPIMMPHRVIGRSVADIVFDIQKIKTVLWRQYLDAGYLANAPRMYVDTTKGVNLDDLLTVRPGGVIRGKGPDGVTPLVIPHTGEQALQGMLAMDEVREARTGVAKSRNITNPNSLNKSATEVNAAEDASNQRIELIARVFAETGVQDLFRKIQKLGAQNHQQPLTLRINGKWEAVDPREWKTGFDIIVNVGLGTGNKDKQIQHFALLAQAQQAGHAIGIVTPQNSYNLAIESTKAMGLKNVDRFWTEPPPNPPPPPPPPEIAVAQIKAQNDLKIAQMKQQADTQHKQLEAQATAQEAQARAQADIVIQQHHAETQAQVDQAANQGKIQVEMAKHQATVEADLAKARLDGLVKIQVARIAAGDGDGEGLVEELLKESGMPVSAADGIHKTLNDLAGHVGSLVGHLNDAKTKPVPPQAIRGADGRISHVRKGDKIHPVLRDAHGKTVGLGAPQ